MARIYRFVVPDLPHHVTQRAPDGGGAVCGDEYGQGAARAQGRGRIWRAATMIAEESAPALIAALMSPPSPRIAVRRSCRPLGRPPFLDRFTALTARNPRPEKLGCKPRLAAEGSG
jgi:hypothetical protein